MATQYSGIDLASRAGSTSAWIVWTSANSTASTDTTWTDWSGTTTSNNTTTAVANNIADTWYYYYWTTVVTDEYLSSVAPVSPATREAAAQRLREARARAEEQAIQYDAAKRRAEEFLYENLTDEQRAQLRRNKFFVVQGGRSRKRYRIQADVGYQVNISELDGNGRVTQRLCAHLTHAANAPVYDHLLAQKLMLEHDEAEFLKQAIRHAA